MITLKYIILNILTTLLRFLPLPAKTGLLKIGNPGRDAPLFLTCNYILSVERVKKALSGMNCYLLIANSRGINVWCAATGGLLTNHSVISVLKTSGIERLVDHRRVILPQLAASGVEAKVIKEKTGWEVIWGPVYAKDIPRFIENELRKASEMREVSFPLTSRVEMAISWAFPTSLISSLLLLPFFREAILPLIILVWGFSFLIFVSFPLYSGWLSPSGERVGFVFFDFGRGGIQLILWGIFMLFLLIPTILDRGFTWGLTLRWGLVSLFIVLILSLDLMGSTPVFKSGLHKDRLLKVVLEEAKCKACGSCEEVCPRDCYRVDRTHHLAEIVRGDRCVQCGACIVQCPFDALYFQAPDGGIIPPEIIRKFKLNLLGKRLIKV